MSLVHKCYEGRAPVCLQELVLHYVPAPSLIIATAPTDSKYDEKHTKTQFWITTLG